MDRQDVSLKVKPETGLLESGLPREAYALLAQANLQRMRGLWEDAAQNCMAALRLAPDSSSAQSLLGDIYENQGRLDDAMQWYQMALDANPDSIADQLKLDRLQHPRTFPLPATPSGSTAASTPQTLNRTPAARAEPEGRSGLYRLLRDPETALRVCAILAALAVVLLVGLAYVTVRHGAAGLGSKADTEVKSTPVVVPAAAGTLPSDADATAMRDTSEQMVLTDLQASSALSGQSITVYDVQIDPRTQQMTVTFGLAAGEGVTRAQVMRSALQTIQAAASGQASTAFTARCLLVSADASGRPSGALAFAGDVTRMSLPADSAGLSDSQIQGLFTGVWWSPTANIRA